MFAAAPPHTYPGGAVRAETERTTYAQMAAPIAAIGADSDELFSLLGPWGAAIRAERGYLTSGANDLAKPGSSR